MNKNKYPSEYRSAKSKRMADFTNDLKNLYKTYQETKDLPIAAFACGLIAGVCTGMLINSRQADKYLNWVEKWEECPIGTRPSKARTHESC